MSEIFKQGAKYVYKAVLESKLGKAVDKLEKQNRGIKPEAVPNYLSNEGVSKVEQKYSGANPELKDTFPPVLDYKYIYEEIPKNKKGNIASENVQKINKNRLDVSFKAKRFQQAHNFNTRLKELSNVLSKDGEMVDTGTFEEIDSIRNQAKKLGFDKNSTSETDWKEVNNQGFSTYFEEINALYAHCKGFLIGWKYHEI